VIGVDRHRLAGLLGREAADRLEPATGRGLARAGGGGERRSGQRERGRDAGVPRPQDGGFTFISDICQ
jgi:hypothetical protein